MFTHLRSLLDRSLHSANIHRVVDATRVHALFLEEVTERWGSPARSMIRLGALQGGVLRISVASPALAQELRNVAADIIKKINMRLGTDAVQRLTLRVQSAQR